ncbi:MAG: hypothetical protein AAF434_14700 [Pseudomonadota bacterium]
MNTDNLEQGIAFLAQNGLNLWGVLDCARIPESARELFSPEINPSAYSRLIVLGNTGAQLWKFLQARGMDRSDPIDSASLDLAKRFCESYLPRGKHTVVFPTDYVVPLQRVGAILGWGEPSPLGIGIHPERGLWWAYRSAIMTSIDVPVTTVVDASSPCDQCKSRACENACPAGAVNVEASFNVDACFRSRALKNSICRDRCHARLACPVGNEYRYPMAMHNYIYKNSMKTVLNYVRD